MAGGIRLTKGEREYLRQAVEFSREMNLQAGDRRGMKSADAIIAKLEAAEKPKGAGVGAAVAVEAFREVLGARLIAPLPSARGVWAQIQNRLNALGLSRMDCVSAAKVAGSEWRGSIKAESIVRQADRLLQAAQGDLWGSGGAVGRSPVAMDDL
jgi:hypothetical protein